MHEQEWTPLASGDGVQAQSIYVDVPTGKRIRETRRQIRCSENRARAGGTAPEDASAAVAR
jgi:hypothetical protein